MVLLFYQDSVTGRDYGLIIISGQRNRSWLWSYHTTRTTYQVVTMVLLYYQDNVTGRDYGLIILPGQRNRS